MLEFSKSADVTVFSTNEFSGNPKFSIELDYDRAITKIPIYNLFRLSYTSMVDDNAKWVSHASRSTLSYSSFNGTDFEEQYTKESSVSHEFDWFMFIGDRFTLKYADNDDGYILYDTETKRSNFHSHTEFRLEKLHEESVYYSFYCGYRDNNEWFVLIPDAEQCALIPVSCDLFGHLCSADVITERYPTRFFFFEDCVKRVSIVGGRLREEIIEGAPDLPANYQPTVCAQLDDTVYFCDEFSRMLAWDMKTHGLIHDIGATRCTDIVFHDDELYFVYRDQMVPGKINFFTNALFSIPVENRICSFRSNRTEYPVLYGFEFVIFVNIFSSTPNFTIFVVNSKDSTKGKLTVLSPIYGDECLDLFYGLEKDESTLIFQDGKQLRINAICEGKIAFNNKTTLSYTEHRFAINNDIINVEDEIYSVMWGGDFIWICTKSDVRIVSLNDGELDSVMCVEIGEDVYPTVNVNRFCGSQAIVTGAGVSALWTIDGPELQTEQVPGIDVIFVDENSLIHTYDNKMSLYSIEDGVPVLVRDDISIQQEKISSSLVCVHPREVIQYNPMISNYEMNIVKYVISEDLMSVETIESSLNIEKAMQEHNPTIIEVDSICPNLLNSLDLRTRSYPKVGGKKNGMRWTMMASVL
ncbi:hypothetical protein PCE1_001900 [Barthelona sp. PCE]